MTKDVLSNQILLESIDYLFMFIQIKIAMLKDLKLDNITYQKGLLILQCHHQWNDLLD